MADVVDLPRLLRAEAGALDAAETRRVLDALDGHRLEPLFVLALTAGLRRGELIGLRWQDVDLDAGTLHVRGTLDRYSHLSDAVRIDAAHAIDAVLESA